MQHSIANANKLTWELDWDTDHIGLGMVLKVFVVPPVAGDTLHMQYKYTTQWKLSSTASYYIHDYGTLVVVLSLL